MNKLFYFIILISFRNGLHSQTISIESKIGKSNTNYTFIKKNTCTIAFTDIRPDKNDKTILMCIPAAFTNLQNLKVDGIYSVNGKIENKLVLNHT
jgi:hypothetical protein